jgi:hypothetical protein
LTRPAPAEHSYYAIKAQLLSSCSLAPGPR